MIVMRLPEGLYQVWLSEYRHRHPDDPDPWHKYQYLQRRTAQYLHENAPATRWDLMQNARSVVNGE